MANDIDKTSPHYKGEFGSIYEVNQKFPSGGVEGDYVAIDGWAHYWNADRGTWCVNAQRDSYWDELITGIIEKFKLFKGATYMGVANLGSVPAKAIGAKMYYFATEAGTYKNFGELVVPQGINVLYSENGSSWVCSTLLEVAQKLGVSTRNVVSQKAVNDALNLKANQSSVNEALAKKADKETVNIELGKKFDKESVAQESGDSEELVMSQKAVSDKLSDLSKSINNISIIDESYFDLSNFTEAENVETNKGVYGFGQGLNDTPLHPTASFTKKFSKILEAPNGSGIYLYLKGCHVANKEFRTYAVYDKDGKLIREGVSTTNVVLYIERDFTVLAFCEDIYYANAYAVKANSINEKLHKIDKTITEQLNGINIDPQSTTFFDTAKMTKVTADAEVLTGLYGFGQGLNDTPLFTANGNTLKYVTKAFSFADRGLFIYLQGCSVANKDYRTYAVYDKDGKLIREGVCTTNVVLYIKEKSTILACCNNIYIAYTNIPFDSVNEKFDSVNEKVNNLFRNDAFVKVIDNCQGIDISKLEDASSVVTKCEINGIYTFGQAIDVEPTFKSDKHKTYKLEIAELNNSAINRILFYVKNLSVANNSYRSWAIYAGDDNKLIKEGTSAFANADTAFFVTGLGNWYNKITILISCVGDGVFYYSRIVKDFKYDIQKHVNQLEAKPLITKLLTGKTVWTLWDSLGENTWQSYFSDLSGANFLSNLNVSSVRPISQGGTTSMPDIDTGTQARARNLVYYKNTHQIDIVFIENINDRNVPVSQRGTIEDKPFMRSQKITYNSDKTLTSYDEAVTYWNNNFDKIVESIDSSKRLTGSMIAIPYTSGNLTDRGSKFTIKSTASKEGDIIINLNGIRSVHVTPSMTIDEIVDAFKIYSWGSGWTFIKLSNNSFSIVYYTSTSVRGTFDGADTGVTADVVDTGANSEKIFYFTSKNISTWSNKENWSDSISLYSAYKGLIEYLRTELPNTMLYFVMPFSVNVNFNDSSSLKNEDGTWSQDKFVNSGIYKTMVGVNDVQKEVCNYYGIQYLDLVKYGGIGINNIENFFYSNNVHPKREGYKKYAEMIYKRLPK